MEIINDMCENIEQVPVKIAVAISEGGTIKVAVADTHWIQQDRLHKQMLEDIRNDKQLWSLRYIDTKIPYPVTRQTIE